MNAALLKRLVTSGCSNEFDEETNRKIQVVNLFSFVGTGITAALGVRALLAQEFSLAFLLVAASALFALSRQIQIWFNTAVGRLISVSLLIGCLMVLIALLVVTGGVHNTGPLWIYIVPPVAMFLAGFRRGLLAIGGFVMIISILLFFPNDTLLLTHYPTEFKTRLLYSFLTVTFLSAFYEFSRQKTFDTVIQLSDRFERQALEDPLTNLANRRGMQNHLDLEVARAQRMKSPLSIVLVDIDHFKSINDTYGHSSGDIVLSQVSKLFKSKIRHQDRVARWGGEEFLFVLPDTEEINACYLANKIRQQLNDTLIRLDNDKITVTASFGVCEVDENTNLKRALTLADKALYYAKDHGRNLVMTASSLPTEESDSTT